MRRPRPLENLYAPGIERIAPYRPGASPEQAAGGRDPSEFAKLASNENPLGCGPLAARALAGVSPGAVARYPDGDGAALKRALARSLGVEPGHILLGNGSNEVLELVAQLFLGPGVACVYSRHAFVVYRLATLARGARPVEVPDKDFGHDLDAMAAACQDPEVRLAYVANPNNPTGSWHEPKAVRGFLEAVPPGVMVILDEAYHEYVEDGPGDSIGWVAEFDNLMVTRSFSKIHGLAALRIGYGIANPELAGTLNRIRQPFNVNALAQAAARAALEDVEFVARSKEANRDALRKIEGALDRLGIARAPTRANFVMAGFADAAGAYAHLLSDGLITRPLESQGLPGHLRITTGAPEENDRLVASLERAFA